MSTNPFADFLTPATATQQQDAQPQQPNPFGDFIPPLSPAQKAAAAAAAKGPVTAADRVDALEGGILRGGAYLAGGLPDAAVNTFNLARAGLGAGYHELTGNAIPSSLEVNQDASPVSAWLSEQFDKSPMTSTQLRRPDDTTSRYLSAIGGAVPSAALGGGGGIASTTRALAGAVPSVAAGQTVLEAKPFESDTANTTASVLAQALTGAGAPAVAKLGIRGTSPAAMQSNIAAFRDAGAEPSLAQAAGTPRMQFLESGLAKIPGGAGVLRQAAETQAQNLRSGVDETVDTLAPGGVSPERAGRAITQGIMGEGGFRDQFNAKAADLFNAVDDQIPGESQVPVSNTLGVLDKIAKPNPLAPQTTAALINPKVASIRQAMLSDLGEDGSTLPYSSLSDLRSRVGEMLTGSEITTDIPRMQVKRLYGALSSDMQGAAQDAGPAAVQAFNRAQSYYSAGMQRMDVLADVLEKNGGPEQVFNGAMAGTKDGATRLRAVMQSLEPEQQQVVAGTVFRRMGQATAGNQNAAGDVFSPETFLTNYNRTSDEAKSALFDRVPGLQDSAENLADVAENLRKSSSVFRNASGTAAGEAQTHTLRDLLVGSLLGGEGLTHLGPEGLSQYGPHLLAVGAGVPAAANVLARGMVSPTMVDWAARPALGSASQAASALSIAPNLSAQQKLAQALAGQQP